MSRLRELSVHTVEEAMTHGPGQATVALGAFLIVIIVTLTKAE